MLEQARGVCRRRAGRPTATLDLAFGSTGRDFARRAARRDRRTRRGGGAAHDRRGERRRHRHCGADALARSASSATCWSRASIPSCSRATSPPEDAAARERARRSASRKRRSCARCATFGDALVARAHRRQRAARARDRVAALHPVGRGPSLDELALASRRRLEDADRCGAERSARAAERRPSGVRAAPETAPAKPAPAKAAPAKSAPLSVQTSHAPPGRAFAARSRASASRSARRFRGAAIEARRGNAIVLKLPQRLERRRPYASTPRSSKRRSPTCSASPAQA